MKASDWISVEDELPKNGERVLVLREYNGEQIAEVAMRTRWYWNEDCFGCDNVTHWQEIVLPKKDELFEQCWLNYRRKGSKKKSLEHWQKLSNEEREQTKKHILAYIESVSDVKYQKDFERYLRDKCFLNVVYKDGKTIFDAENKEETSCNNKLVIGGTVYR